MTMFEKLKRETTFWLGRRLPTCVEITELLSQSMDRSLTLRERVRLRMHFLICDPCSLYQKGLRFLSLTMQGRAAHEVETSEGLSLEARERMKKLLTQEPGAD